MPVDDQRSANLREIDADIAQILQAAGALEKRYASELDRIPEEWRPSARNLLHYLALRADDRRSLQERLSRLGLSSLGRSEAHVGASLQAVRAMIADAGCSAHRPIAIGSPDFPLGSDLLRRHTEELLGPRPETRDRYLMVTLSEEAVSDYEMVRALVEAGMDCARINAGKNTPSEWRAMAEHVRRASDEVGRPCRVLVDLAGPKVRTGPLEAGPGVLDLDPKRDAYGRPRAPLRIRLVPNGPGGLAPENSADAAIPVGADWLDSLDVDETVTFADARGKRRTARIAEKNGDARTAILEERSFLRPGIRLEAGTRTTRIGEFPAPPGFIRVREGDRIVLTADEEEGSSRTRLEDGGLERPHRIGCTLPRVFGDVKVGERVVFDEGKIEGRVVRVRDASVELEVSYAKNPTGTKLKANQSINFPDTTFTFSGLTEKDIGDLETIAHVADLVGLSFVNRSDDVEHLHDELDRYGSDAGVLLKIETRQGFQNLPDLILTGMRRPPLGVMIARGDLAVELGWERLAEVQEEILWMSEAAHVPVVWATQVLEDLLKRGRPSRPEITDAAMGERAECIMLNKGKHVVDALHTLDDIIHRMSAHQYKKRARLRKLAVAAPFGSNS